MNGAGGPKCDTLTVKHNANKRTESRARATLLLSISRHQKGARIFRKIGLARSDRVASGSICKLHFTHTTSERPSNFSPLLACLESHSCAWAWSANESRA